MHPVKNNFAQDEDDDRQPDLSAGLNLSFSAHPSAEAGGPATNVAITVFAASSATDVLTALAKKFEADRRIEVRLSFAASSILARQIEQDAPCDIFVSADQKWMDYLAGKRKIQAGSRKDIAGNRLVVITPADRKMAVRMERGFYFAGAFTGRLAARAADWK